MTDETTSEQLAEIEGQAAEYTPPEGWRVLQVGEALRDGDLWVNQDGTERRSAILHWDAAAVSGGRCIRRIKPQPQPQPEPASEPQAESDAELRIRLLQQANESQAETIGRLLSEARDLNMEIGGLERQLLQRDARIRDVETMHAAAAQAVVDAGKVNDKLRAQADELRSEISYVQNLLGTERRRVTELEELVGSLRTINVTQEKAFTAAGKENTALRNQLAAVASVAADRQRLLIELDAAQQVPADSPELRQLRADLAEVTQERDQYLDSYQRIFGDLETIRETTKAAAVEAIAEWLEPIRAVDNEHLANETLQHLPQIMRHLVGLDSHAID